MAIHRSSPAPSSASSAPVSVYAWRRGGFRGSLPSVAEIRLRSHASLSDLERTLREQATEADDVMVTFAGRHPKDYLGSYLGWVNRPGRCREAFCSVLSLN